MFKIEKAPPAKPIGEIEAVEAEYVPDRDGSPALRPGRGGGFSFNDRDRKQVETMVGMGLTQAQIAHIMQISVGSLQKYFPAELHVGMAAANLAVAKNLYEVATSKENGSVPAAIFWLKARAGWKTTEEDKEKDNNVTIKIVGGLPEISQGWSSSDEKP